MSQTPSALQHRAPLDQERQGWRGLFRRDAKMGQPRVGFLTQLHSYDYRRKEFFNERVGIRRPSYPLVYALSL